MWPVRNLLPSLCFLRVGLSIPRLRNIDKHWGLGFPGGASDPPASEGVLRDVGFIPGLGRSPGGGHGNPHQYSCQENPMDREAWQATVPGVTLSWTRLKQLSMHTCDWLLRAGQAPLSSYRPSLCGTPVMASWACLQCGSLMVG